MDSCLFVQWKKSTDASRFVIDGVPCEYNGSSQQNSIMNLLSQIPGFHEIYRNNDREELSPSFRCSRKGDRKTLYAVEGNFEETDEAGRKLVYIFITHESDPEKIADILQNYSSILEVTPNTCDLEEVKKLNFKKKNLVGFLLEKIKYINKNDKLLWITIVIIFILLFVLLNHQNKQ